MPDPQMSSYASLLVLPRREAYGMVHREVQGGCEQRTLFIKSATTLFSHFCHSLCLLLPCCMIKARSLRDGIEINKEQHHLLEKKLYLGSWTFNFPQLPWVRETVVGFRLQALTSSLLLLQLAPASSITVILVRRSSNEING